MCHLLSPNLVSELSELLLHIARNLALGLDQVLACSLLLLVVCLALDLASLLEAGDDILVLPAELVTKTTDSAVLAARLEAEDTESLWDDLALLVVVWWWDALEGLQALECLCAALGLVRNHAADSAPEHLSWRTVVPWTTTGCVVTSLLAHEGLVLHCGKELVVCWPVDTVLYRVVSKGDGGGMRRTLGAEELSRDVEGLAADDDNLLAIEELLGHGRGETTEKMSLAVNDNLYCAVLVQCFFFRFFPNASLLLQAPWRRLIFSISLSQGLKTYHRFESRHVGGLGRWVMCVVDLRFVKSKIVRIGEVGAKSRLSQSAKPDQAWELR